MPLLLHWHPIPGTASLSATNCKNTTADIGGRLSGPDRVNKQRPALPTITPKKKKKSSVRTIRLYKTKRILQEGLGLGFFSSTFIKHQKTKNKKKVNHFLRFYFHNRQHFFSYFHFFFFAS